MNQTFWINDVISFNNSIIIMIKSLNINSFTIDDVINNSNSSSLRQQLQHIFTKQKSPTFRFVWEARLDNRSGWKSPLLLTFKCVLSLYVCFNICTCKWVLSLRCGGVVVMLWCRWWWRRGLAVVAWTHGG